MSEHVVALIEWVTDFHSLTRDERERVATMFSMIGCEILKGEPWGRRRLIEITRPTGDEHD